MFYFPDAEVDKNFVLKLESYQNLDYLLKVTKMILPPKLYVPQFREGGGHWTVQKLWVLL